MINNDVVIKDICDKSLNLPDRMSIPLWLILNVIVMPFSFILSLFITAGNGGDVATISIDEAKKDAYLKYLMEFDLSHLLSAQHDKSLSRKARKIIKTAIDKKTYDADPSEEKINKSPSSPEILISDSVFCIKASALLKELNAQAPDRLYEKSRGKDVLKIICGTDFKKTFPYPITVAEADKVLALCAPDYQENPELLNKYISFVNKPSSFFFENKEMASGFYCYLTEQPEKGMYRIKI